MSFLGCNIIDNAPKLYEPQKVKTIKLFLCCLIMLSLGACQTISGRKACPGVPLCAGNTLPYKATALNHWTIQGVSAIKTKHGVWTANFIWRQVDPREYMITIFYPFNLSSIMVYGNRKLLTIKTAQGMQQIIHPEEFGATQLGYPIPIAALYYWMRGLPAPNMPIETITEQYNQLSTISQKQLHKKSSTVWKVSFIQYGVINNMYLPKKINIENKNLKIKLVIYSWNNI